MNKMETVKLLSVLRAAYPAFYRDVSGEDLEMTVTLWQSLFARENYNMVQAAVLSLINSRAVTYPPVPGEVTQKIYELRNTNAMTEQEAWGKVYKAICNSNYNSEEEFNKLPPDIQRLVGSPAQLREWAIMEASELQTVVASNFQRSFKVRQASSREYEMLPPSVKNFVSEIAASMAMPALEDGST